MEFSLLTVVSFVEVEMEFFHTWSDPVLIMPAKRCKEQTQESTWDRRSPQCPSVYSSHKTLLWYVSPSDLLNCDLPGSMPCPLNEHVHWNTGWGLASTIWTNTSAEEFWLSTPFPKWSLHCDQGRSAKASGITLNLRQLSTVLWPLRWSLSSKLALCPIKGHHKPILTFFSSLHCIFGSLYFETLNWPLRAPLNTSAIIKAGQAIDWTPVNSAPLHILSSPFSVSHKVLNASSSLPEPSAVRGHYLHVSPAGSQHGRWGTRDGRAEGALRENIKVCPVPNVSWDD